MRVLRLVFERQWLHWICLALLLWGFERVSRLESFRVGELAGWSSLTWAWVAVAIAVAHQLMVWFVWRIELHTGRVSGALGDLGFRLYAVLFAVLFVGRGLAVLGLAVANQGTLDASLPLLRGLALLLLIPNLYLAYSVARYFGIRRAFGADHFDPSYRSKPLVRDGIFRFTENGMYLAGFLILWVFALWYGSVAALWVALFNHLYIWVHYFATERPDMQRIYG